MPHIKGFAGKGISAKFTNLSQNTQMHQTSYKVHCCISATPGDGLTTG